jgi:hypothetical protein
LKFWFRSADWRPSRRALSRQPELHHARAPELPGRPLHRGRGQRLGVGARQPVSLPATSEPSKHFRPLTSGRPMRPTTKQDAAPSAASTTVDCGSDPIRSPWGMSALCAQRPAGVDVERSSRIETAHAVAARESRPRVQASRLVSNGHGRFIVASREKLAIRFRLNRRLEHSPISPYHIRMP